MGGAEDAWTTPHASAKAPQNTRSMLTLINDAAGHASCMAWSNGVCVPQLPVCFRGGGDSGLVRKSARKRLFLTQNNTRGRRQLSTVRGREGRAFGSPCAGNGDGSRRPDGHVAGAPRARAGARCARVGEALSPHALAPDRFRLPAPAHLLVLCRRGARSLRPVGGRLDDARAARPLPPVRNLRARFRAGGAAPACALVPALALRPLARHQCRPRATRRSGHGRWRPRAAVTRPTMSAGHRLSRTAGASRNLTAGAS